MKAFKCDYCGKYCDGEVDFTIKSSEPLTIGFCYSPESDNPKFYYHDYCEECREYIKKMYSDGRIVRSQQERIKNHATI